MSFEGQALRIYQAALALEGAARQAFIDREVGDDERLRERVLSLLHSAAQAQEQGFLDSPHSDNVMVLGTGGKRRRALGELPEIDRYRLIETLGEGGFGTVYLAEQLAPVQREVALKLIRSDRVDSSFARRFAAERQVLALLNHPGIAQIFDAGTTVDGDPYLVMERVDGRSITDFCDQQRLDLRRRIELFITVCAALQHAHQKGVIHRDIKPANVLVTVRDGHPVAKVIDFGIARAADLRVDEHTLQTETTVLGSPLYMSPEQVDSASAVDIDTRADVYSLGVLLYQLLVGTTPFDSTGAPLLEMLRHIAETDPPRPSVRAATIEPALASRRQLTPATLARQLKGDLDCILLRTLEKDRERRYASAAALAADLQRALSNQPIEAQAPSTRYRVSKFVTRHRWGVTASALITLSLVVGLVGTSLGFIRARDEALRAQETLALLQQFLSSPAPDAKGRDLTVVELLEHFAPRVDALSDRPGIQAELLYVYAKTYLALGLFDRAASFAERAVSLRFGLHDESHPRVLAALHLLGRIRTEQGKYADAVALHRDVYRRARAAWSEDALETIEYAVGLGEALAKSGERTEAAALLRDSLQRQRRLLGPNHDATLHSMNQLGESLYALDQREEALALARETAERRVAHFGADHPETLHARSNLSYQLGETGHYEEAAVMDRQILDSRIRVLGEEHRKTLVSMINLAWVLDRMASYEESVAVSRRALSILQRVQGVDGPDTLLAKANLAMTLLKQGDPNAAERMIREVIEARTRVLGSEHPVTLVGIGNLVQVLEQQGRYADALSMVKDLVQRRTAVHGADHHNTLVARNQLSGLLVRSGDYLTAEAVAREALTARIALSGTDSTQSLSVKLNLARALSGRGALDEAEALARDVLQACERALGPEHPSTLTALETLAAIRVEQGEFKDADALFQQALLTRTAKQGEGHPQTLETRARLAELTKRTAH